MIVDEAGNEVINPDLKIGGIRFEEVIKPDAEPLSETKQYYTDSDYIKRQVYFLKTKEEIAQIEEYEEKEKKAKQAVKAAEMAFRSSVQTMKLTDAEAKSVSLMFEDWSIGKPYITGDIVRYSGNLYRSLQKSTGQSTHEPNVATSLWKMIGEPVSGMLPWVQPVGATDAYKKGDKVLHKTRTWVSDIDSNVWEPSIYGWTKV